MGGRRLGWSLIAVGLLAAAGCKEESAIGPPPLPEQVAIERYTIESGLPGNDVFDIFSDSLGRVWITTDRGVAMIDGDTVTAFTPVEGLPHPDCRSVDEFDGRIWVATWGGGVAYYDGSTWETIPEGKDLKSSRVFEIAHDDTSIWFAHVDGADQYVIGKNYWIHFGPSEPVGKWTNTSVGIFDDPTITSVRLINERGREVWFSSKHDGITIFRPRKWMSMGIDTKGMTLYLADVMQGLVIIDGSSPSNMRLLAKLLTPGEPQDVVALGSYAYLADGPAGLEVVDIAEPTSPEIVGSLALSGQARALAYRQDYVYVVGDGMGLQIVDVRQPNNPVAVGSYSVGGEPLGIDLADSLALIAAGSAGLVVVNVADPSSPTLVGTYADAGAIFDVATDGTFAYILGDAGTFTTVSLSDSAAPVREGSTTLPGSTPGKALAVVSGYAYVADRFEGMVIVELNNPQQPRVLGNHIDTPGNASDVAVFGYYAFVADGSAGAKSVYIKNKADPKSKGRYNPPGDVIHYNESNTGMQGSNVNDLLYQSGVVWFALDSDGLGFLDLSRSRWGRYLAADGLPSNVVYQLACDSEGRIWAGTNGGVARIEGDNIVYFSRRNGLPESRVRVVHIDPGGRVWLGFIEAGAGYIK